MRFVPRPVGGQIPVGKVGHCSSVPVYQYMWRKTQRRASPWVVACILSTFVAFSSKTELSLCRKYHHWVSENKTNQQPGQFSAPPTTHTHTVPSLTWLKHVRGGALCRPSRVLHRRRKHVFASSGRSLATPSGQMRNYFLIPELSIFFLIPCGGLAIDCYCAMILQITI